MAGLIPKSFIDDLLIRVDIFEVVDPHVTLKKAGKDYQGLCPFHSEKTPSFTVSQDKQFYHCFGCGAHGSAIGFLMNFRNLEFVDAIEDLAQIAGLEVPREGGNLPVRDDYTPLYEVLEKAQAFFSTQLRTHSERQRAVDYLKGRGLSGQTAKRFGIGYAPEGWDNLLSTLCADGAAIPDLERAGLIIARDNGGHYDRFRDRIVFPIRNRRGRVVAFGGRVIDNGEPKYLNSPETPVFQKRRELYGLYELRQVNSTPDRVLVVEGYMDVAGLAQHDVNNAVATLGTAITPEHIEQLSRVSSEIVFCFDGDAAGRRAAWKALEITLPTLSDGRTVGFLFLPDGEDPDTYVRAQGRAIFDDRDAITPLSEFLLSELRGKTSLSSLDGRARLVDISTPFVKKVPAGSFRELLLNRLAELSRLTVDQVRRQIDGRSTVSRTQFNNPRPIGKRRYTLAGKALSLLLHAPQLASTVSAYIGQLAIDDAECEMLESILELGRNNPHLSVGALIEQWRGDAKEQMLAVYLATPSPLPETNLEAELGAVLEQLKLRAEKSVTDHLGDTKPSQLSDADKESLRQRLAAKKRS